VATPPDINSTNYDKSKYAIDEKSGTRD
jgi:hypothetical protein